MTIYLPANYQLFGPVQEEGALRGKIGSTWWFPPVAFTASTKRFDFSIGYPRAGTALWRLIWKPGDGGEASIARLVHMDDNSGNITEIARINGQSQYLLSHDAVYVTNQINELVDAKVNKNIGYQMQDNGVNEWTIYESRLEINWKLLL
jgi:hypothetical protein